MWRLFGVGLLPWSPVRRVERRRGGNGLLGLLPAQGGLLVTSSASASPYCSPRRVVRRAGVDRQRTATSRGARDELIHAAVAVEHLVQLVEIRRDEHPRTAATSCCFRLVVSSPASTIGHGRDQLPPSWKPETCPPPDRFGSRREGSRDVERRRAPGGTPRSLCQFQRQTLDLFVAVGSGAVEEELHRGR